MVLFANNINVLVIDKDVVQQKIRKIMKQLETLVTPVPVAGIQYIAFVGRK
jgi:hypothetical protein